MSILGEMLQLFSDVTPVLCFNLNKKIWTQKETIKRKSGLLDEGKTKA